MKKRRIVSDTKQAKLLSSEVAVAAKRGARLFPCRRDKTPYLKNWPVQATSQLATLRDWAHRYPGCNWGLATGSGVFVVDLDSEDARRELENLGSLPETYTVGTPRGYHFYFTHPSDTEVRNSVKKLGAHIDVRGKGGYVIIPPSVNESGVPYTLHRNLPVAPAPKWLLELLKKVQTERFAPPPAPVESKVTSTAAIPEGQRNDTLASLAGTMRKRGMTLGAIERALLAENEARCTPVPLPEDEVRAIARSVYRYEPAQELIVGERPFAQMVPDAERLLKKRPEERMFQTPLSRRLVRIIQHRQDPCPERDVWRDPRANVMVDVDAKYLQLALGRTGTLCKLDRLGNPRPIDGPRSLADMMLASVETSSEMTTWDRLRRISLTPILLADGTLVTDEGYNPASHIWVNKRGITFADPAERNPRLSARECRALVERNIHPIGCAYPFAKEHPDQQWHQTPSWSVVLSAMMSVDDRHNLPTVHMYCVTAPVQGSGKTKLVQAISAAMTGTLPSIVTYDGVEEFGKHLAPLLGKGDPVICIDNVIMTINNAKLAAALTQEHCMSYRPLGFSEDKTIENTSVIFVTGNNLQVSGDMPRRCLLVRIEPQEERPDKKKFPFDPVKRAMKLFPRAVMTVKAVIRAHQLAGYPGIELLKGESGSYPDWDRRVRALLVWMGYPDPLLTQDAIWADDPGQRESLEVLWILGEAFGRNSFQVRELEGKLTHDALTMLKQACNHKIGEEFNARKIGRYFSTHLCGRWFEGHRLVKTGRTPRGSDEWRLETKQEQLASHGEEEPL